jgi:hypothetical protein
MSAPACEAVEDVEQIDDIDGICEFFRDEPLVATLPISALWKCAEPLPAQASATTQQVQCCVCLTATDISKMATYAPCGHVVACEECFRQLRRRDIEAERDTLCPKCRALVTSTLRVFV